MAKGVGSNDSDGKSRGLRRGSNGVADWTSATATLLQRAVVSAASTGGALRFGYTSDGGAYSIGIYGDGAPYTEYVSGHQEVDITLEAIVELFEAIADERATKAKGA